MYLGLFTNSGLTFKLGFSFQKDFFAKTSLKDSQVHTIAFVKQKVEKMI